uniref:Uncharacterized protein n=1 Tax=Oryza rufipogon TaxID=4529 RepID=A0A0E0QIA1_ORYRU
MVARHRNGPVSQKRGTVVDDTAQYRESGGSKNTVPTRSRSTVLGSVNSARTVPANALWGKEVPEEGKALKVAAQSRPHGVIFDQAKKNCLLASRHPTPIEGRKPQKREGRKAM